MEPGSYGSYSAGYPALLARLPITRDRPAPRRRLPKPTKKVLAIPRYCIDCGALIAPTGKAGRPTSRCAACRTT